MVVIGTTFCFSVATKTVGRFSLGVKELNVGQKLQHFGGWGCKILAAHVTYANGGGQCALVVAERSGALREAHVYRADTEPLSAVFFHDQTGDGAGRDWDAPGEKVIVEEGAITVEIMLPPYDATPTRFTVPMGDSIEN